MLSAQCSVLGAVSSGKCGVASVEKTCRAGAVVGIVPVYANPTVLAWLRPGVRVIRASRAIRAIRVIRAIRAIHSGHSFGSFIRVIGSFIRVYLHSSMAFSQRVPSKPGTQLHAKVAGWAGRFWQVPAVVVMA